MRPLLIAAALPLLASLQSACTQVPAAPAAPDIAVASSGYVEAALAINATMRANLYDPAELERPDYKDMESRLLDLARSSTTDEEFLAGFGSLWKSGPFSHVTLQPARHTAEETAAYLDTLRVGDGAALSWQGDAAVLSVKTMMGLDTIEQIDAAYDEIARHGASRLVIDLRGNGGGAFAVVPLIEHVLSEPFDAGSFVARRWNAENDRAPTPADLQQIVPWTGWSIRSFWADVTYTPLTRIRFEPRPDPYTGPVFVLIDRQTASAAEMAADALKASGRARLIGETTAGQMLSQKMFDIPGGFQLSLPIADYYSTANGRIEGQGVTPDVPTSPGLAMDIALTM